MQEPKIATVGTKGQVVIPLTIRKELGIKPKTKLAMYSRSGRLVVAKLKVPTLREELTALFREVDHQRKGKKKLTEREILEEIQAYRIDKRASKGA